MSETKRGENGGWSVEEGRLLKDALIWVLRRAEEIRKTLKGDALKKAIVEAKRNADSFSEDECANDIERLRERLRALQELGALLMAQGAISMGDMMKD